MPGSSRSTVTDPTAGMPAGFPAVTAAATSDLLAAASADSWLERVRTSPTLRRARSIGHRARVSSRELSARRLLRPAQRMGQRANAICGTSAFDLRLRTAGRRRARTLRCAERRDCRGRIADRRRSGTLYLLRRAAALADAGSRARRRTTAAVTRRPRPDAVSPRQARGPVAEARLLHRVSVPPTSLGRSALPVYETIHRLAHPLRRRR